MDTDDVTTRLTTLIADHLGIEENQVSQGFNSTFEAMNADSLDRLEIVMAIEEAFGLDIPDDDALHLQSPQDAYDYLQYRMRQS